MKNVNEILADTRAWAAVIQWVGEQIEWNEQNAKEYAQRAAEDDSKWDKKQAEESEEMKNAYIRLLDKLNK